MTWRIFNPEGTTGGEPQDMLFRSWVSGPYGAYYELLREKQHTREDVIFAKRYLRRNYDVVGIYVVREESLRTVPQ